MKKMFILLFLFIPFLASAAETKTIDHEGFKINRALSDQASMWDGYVFGQPGHYASYSNDFFEYTAGDWTLTTTENGSGDASEALADEVYGIISISLDNSLNDADGFQLGAESFKPTAGKNIYFETKLKMSDATDTDILFGLVVTDTSPEAHANGIVFEKDDADTQWDFKTTASSVTSSESNIATAQTTNYVTLGFRVIGTSHVEYWVDDIYQGVLTSSIPSTDLRPTMYYLNGTEGDSEILNIDYIFVSQER